LWFLRSAAGAFAGFRLTDKVRDKGLELREALRINTVANGIAFDISLDQSCILKLLQVLRNSGLGEREFLNNVSADTGAYFQQIFNDGNPCRMPKGLHQTGYPVLVLCEMIRFGCSHILLLHCNNTIKAALTVFEAKRASLQ
jgi:hypothetical protein